MKQPGHTGSDMGIPANQLLMKKYKEPQKWHQYLPQVGALCASNPGVATTVFAHAISRFHSLSDFSSPGISFGISSC
jgi:hypothetical protein